MQHVHLRTNRCEPFILRRRYAKDLQPLLIRYEVDTWPYHPMLTQLIIRLTRLVLIISIQNYPYTRDTFSRNLNMSKLLQSLAADAKSRWSLLFSFSTKTCVRESVWRFATLGCIEKNIGYSRERVLVYM